MKEFRISKIVFIFVFLISILTLFIMFVMFLMGDYEINLFLENMFFVLSTIACITILPKLDKLFSVNLTESIKVHLYLFVFLLIIVGNVYNVLMFALWFDKLLHLYSGFFLVSIGVLFANKWVPYASVEIKANIGFMYSISIALLWEIFEFIGDVFLSIVYPSYEITMQFYHLEKEVWIFPQPYAIVDTMLDLSLGTLGAIIFVVIYRKLKKS